MKPQINNIIQIPFESLHDFLSYWLVFLKPFHNMTMKCIEIAVIMLELRHELSKKVTDRDLLDNLILQESSKKEIVRRSGISQNQFRVILTGLRHSKFIIDNKINHRFIPNYNDEEQFKLLVLFNRKDESK